MKNIHNNYEHIIICYFKTSSQSSVIMKLAFSKGRKKNETEK